MLANLEKWLEAEPALGWVRVDFADQDIGPWYMRDAEVNGLLTGVLATDDLSPEGVRELCEATWVCGNCGDSGTETNEICRCWEDGGSTAYLPVAARILIWAGQDVEDWTRTLGFQSCPKCGAFNLYDETTLAEDENPCSMAHEVVALTAVILCASDPAPAQRVRECRDACAKSVVQFVIAKWDYAEAPPVFGPVLRYEAHSLDGEDLGRLEL